jgi:nucleotide-binding universal stress UspA family protein
MSHNEKHTVVVGIDGSPRSLPVLEWAAAYATSTGAEVKVVTAWHYPEVPGDRPARVEADLVVMGARGRDNTPRLGSVTGAVLLQAHCPVVVVPVRNDAPTDTP